MNLADLFSNIGGRCHSLPAIRSTDPEYGTEAQHLSELLFSTQALAPPAAEDTLPTALNDNRAADAGMKSHTLPNSSSQAGPSYSYLSSSASSSRNSSPPRNSSEQARFEAACSFVARTFARERETGITNWPIPDEFEAQRLLEQEEDNGSAYDDVHSYAPNVARERGTWWIRFARLWERECEKLRLFPRRLGNQAHKGGRW